MGPIGPMWHQVLPCADLPTGKLAKVIVAGAPVLLARLDDGTVAAASAVCPPRGEDLSGGLLYFDAIDCPWPHYVSALRTGATRSPHDVSPADLAARLDPLPLFPV